METPQTALSFDTLMIPNTASSFIYRYPSKETQHLLCRGISADGGSEVVQDEDDEITVPTQPTRADSYYSQDEIDLD